MEKHLISFACKIKILFFAIMMILNLLSVETNSAGINFDYPLFLKLKPQEFGQIIFRYMPDKNEQGFYWNYTDNDQDVIWLDSTYTKTTLTDGNYYLSRKGITRVNVLEKKIIDHKQYEIPWMIVFEGTADKFGVNSISFFPTMPEIDGDICFRESFNVCEFLPFKSLTKVGISFKEICEKKFSAGNFEKVYILSHTNKKSVYGIWGTKSISGFSSSSFKLVELGNEKEICENLMGGWMVVKKHPRLLFLSSIQRILQKTYYYVARVLQF